LDNQYIGEIEAELERILNFWIDLKDVLHGGFYCRVGYGLEVDRTSDKSGIAAARTLWTFSRAYTVFRDNKYLDCARHAYSFLVRNLIDSRFGGAFWLLDYEGNAVDTRKHIYLQAFCIYGLAEYYLAAGDGKALEHAMKLWTAVEQKGFDEQKQSYHEEFTREWDRKDNELLSEHGLGAEITANTYLHLLEAYTVLYRAVPTSAVRNSLLKVLDIFEKKIYKPDQKQLGVFFDSEWNEMADIQSYGHEIEASWLIDCALKVLSLKDEKYHKMVTDLAWTALDSGVNDDGSMANECFDNVRDERRIWWVQAESLIGFYNAAAKTGDTAYETAFEDSWDYIWDNIIDRRPGGEWIYGRTPLGDPMKRDVVEHWKTPYHNARCCLEVIDREKKK